MQAAAPSPFYAIYRAKFSLGQFWVLVVTFATIVKI